MRINLIILMLVAAAACTKKPEISSDGKGDIYSKNFTRWVNGQTVENDRIVVLNYGLCHYCDNKINQVLINSNCIANNDVSFVLATDKNLPIMLDTLNRKSTHKFF